MKDTDMEIDDIFFYKNKLRYSIAHYDKLPPRVKFVRLKKPGDDAFVDMPYAHIRREQLQIYYASREMQKK